MEKQINVNGRIFKIRELLNKETKQLPQFLDSDTDDIKKQKNEDALKIETTLCTGLSDDEYNALTRKEYLTIRLAILELNTPERNFWVAG